MAPGAVFGGSVAAAVRADTRTEGFVMLHRSYDNWRADDSHIDQSAGPSIPAPKAFALACEGLVDTVQRAASVGKVPEWVANQWDREVRVYAHYVIREARRLGLYPPTSQLEAENRSVA